MKIKASSFSPALAALCNLALAYVVYMLCRVVYVWENWDLFAPGWEALPKGDLLRGALRFDSAAIFYTNTLYLALMLLPLHLKERRWWHTMTKWIFVVVNALAVAINLSDAVYSQYTGRRTTSTFFSEFSNEGNLGTIFTTELVNHWYLVLAAIAMTALLWFLYTDVDDPGRESRQTGLAPYYAVQTALFLLLFPTAIVAIRGGATRTTRPITLSNANQYVNQPHEAAIVLNTPFTLIRTIGKTTFVDPGYYTPDQLEAIYTPLHSNNQAFRQSSNPKNVVILIVESFGREYIGYYNRHLEGGHYKGYTPFVDSLLERSLTWQTTLANGRKSIDGMPSVLSSIPMFVEPFFVTNYSLNQVGGIAAELGRRGYSSAFFHGAENSSMGFQAFARATGFGDYYGKDDYDKDPRFDGEEDFDGAWAIWDEPFLQYFAAKIGEMREPFVTALFTASSHHPFALPERYREVYPEEALPIHKCIRYTDNALRHFFATASREPWFKNTIFVITSDHTNSSNHSEYMTSIGVYAAPILIYDPSGELPTGMMPGVAQQIDITPTLLGILGHDKPYIAFGKDLLATPADSTWAVNYANGIYQYLQNDTLIQFDGEHVTAAYKLSADTLMKHPLPTHPAWHETRVKAIIQQYMSRMINDKLKIEN